MGGGEESINRLGLHRGVVLPPPTQPCSPLPPAPWETQVPGLTEFAKICVTHACMPMWSMCQIYLCANMVYIPKCLHVTVIYMSICQKHAYFSFLWANLPCGLPMSQLPLPTYQTLCQFFSLMMSMCQKAYQFFKHSYEMLREISILYYHMKTFCIILDIIITYNSYL